ncbi:hypothetical protein F5Y01DRAFT_300043 [Xylaria sp. FL0043]|nr:hypothetical protein F5Y01DRAFT_300043 [Xylaria sp. FL0043]
MPASLVRMQMSPSRAANVNSTSPAGLDTSDIIGVAVGVTSGVIALVGVLVAFVAWRYPDKFRKTKDNLRSLGHTKRARDNPLVSEYGNTFIGGNVRGGIHRDNRAPITYGRVGTMNFNDGTGQQVEEL